MSPRRLARALVNARDAIADIRVERDERRRLAPTCAPAPRTRDAPASPPANALQGLSRVECLRLLASRQVGRLAFIAREGQPLILPVNYTVDGEYLFVRSGAGPKLAAAERRELVSFEVDDIDEVGRRGWSVVVTGRAERLRWAQRGSRVMINSSVRLPETWADGPRPHVIRVHISRITGRWLSEVG